LASASVRGGRSIIRMSVARGGRKRFRRIGAWSNICLSGRLVAWTGYRWLKAQNYADRSATGRSVAPGHTEASVYPCPHPSLRHNYRHREWRRSGQSAMMWGRAHKPHVGQSIFAKREDAL
jgi:hypothetical protein